MAVFLVAECAADYANMSVWRSNQRRHRIQTPNFSNASTMAALNQIIMSDDAGPSARGHFANGTSPHDLTDKAARMTRLFAGSERGHGTHGEPTQQPGSLKWEINGTVRTVSEPTTIALWEKHLQGRAAIGRDPNS
jgi:hypothetical protein